METRRRVLLVQQPNGGSFSLSGLQDFKQKQQGEGVVEDLLKTVTLPHPRTGRPSAYMTCAAGDSVNKGQQHLLELQVARPSGAGGGAGAGGGEQFASFFVDQRVQSDGSVFMASRINPTFLLLPVLAKHTTRWSPLDQMVSSAAAVLLRCSNLHPEALCDVNDCMGEDSLLYRFSPEKALGWLKERVDKCQSRLAARSGEDPSLELAALGSGGGGGAGAAGGDAAISSAVEGFSVPTAGGTDLAGESAAASAAPSQAGDGSGRYLGLALELVGEYVSEEWSSKLASAYGREGQDLFETKHKGGVKRKAAVWESGEEERAEDKMLALAHGVGGGVQNMGREQEQDKKRGKKSGEASKGGTGGGSGSSSSGGGGVGSKAASVKDSRAAKVQSTKLAKAKATTKGMRSLSSFFGKK